MSAKDEDEMAIREVGSEGDIAGPKHHSATEVGKGNDESPGSENNAPGDPTTSTGGKLDDEAAKLHDSAKLAVDIIARDHMEIGMHGFAGTMRFVRESKVDTNTYVFDPEEMTVFVDEVICFRWNRPGLRVIEVDTAGTSEGEPIIVSGRHSDVQPAAGCGAHHFPCTKPGKYRFAIDEPNTCAHCTIDVRPRGSVLAQTACAYASAVLGVFGVIVACVVVLVLWAQQQAFLTGDVEEGSDEYKGLESMEDLVTDTALPWFATAVMLFLVMFIARIAYCFWRARITDYAQGFTATTTRFAQIFVAVITVALAALVLVLWWYLLSVSQGYAELFNTIANTVNDTLNEASSVVTNLNFIIERAPALLGIDVPASATTLLNEVGATVANIQGWSSNGESIVRGLFRVFTIMSFLGLQFILYTVATAFAAARERKAKPLRSAVWGVVVCMIVLCISIGFVSIVHALLERTYETSVAFGSRTLTLAELQSNTGVSTDSPLVQIFGACSGDGVLTIGFLGSMVADIMGTWNTQHSSTSSVQFDLPNITFSTAKEFQDYAVYVDAQLQTIDGILEANPAALSNISSTFRAETAPVLRAAIAVGRSLLGLVDCAVLRDSLGGLMPTLKEDVIEPIETQLAVMYVSLAVMVVFLIVASLAAHIFARPLKFWYEGSTDRWFRFRCAWGAHRRFIKKHGKPAEPPYWVAPPMCTKASFIAFMQMASNANAVMVCLQALLLIILHYSFEGNELAPLLQAVAFCCAVAPVLAVPTEYVDLIGVRITLRVFNLLVVLAGAALAIVFAVGAGNRSRRCYDEIQESRSSNSSNATLYPFTADCTLDSVVRDIEHGTYAAVVGIVCLVSVVTAVSLLVFWKTRAASSLHDEGDAREADTQINRKQKKQQRLIFALVLIVMAMTVVALLIAVVVFNAFGDPPRHPPSSFQRRPSTTGCNGYDANCDRRVHEVVFPTAHNSFSTLERNFIAPNHYYGMQQQLDSGLRGFMIDLWTNEDDTNGTAYLCHKFCRLGAQRTADELKVLKAFLDANPREVVILHLEQYVDTSRVADAFGEANITELLWSPADGLTPEHNVTFAWPTLQELITSGRRVLAFTDLRAGHRLNPTPVPTWLPYMWDYWAETDYAAASVADFGCGYRRGANSDTAVLGRKATVLNHFLTAPLGAPYLASAANMRAVIELHFTQCRREWNRVPNFIALDFWSIGEPLRTVDRLVRSTVLV